MPDEYLAGLSVDDREQNWVRQIATASDQTAIYVTEEEDGANAVRIVGFACGGPRRTGDSAYRKRARKPLILSRGINGPLALQRQTNRRYTGP